VIEAMRKRRRRRKMRRGRRTRKRDEEGFYRNVLCVEEGCGYRGK